MFDYEIFSRYYDMNNCFNKVKNKNLTDFAYGGRASIIKSNQLSRCYIHLWHVQYLFTLFIQRTLTIIVYRLKSDIDIP